MNTTNQKKFISFVKSECAQYGIKFDLRPGKYVEHQKGMKTSGFFYAEKKMLVCATKNPNFIRIVAHEYGHLTQWVDNCKEWIEYDKSEADILDEWLSGKDFNNKKIKRAITASLNLELDNEKRTVRILKKFGMPKSKIDFYIQQSNAYVLFYLYMLETRKWYKPFNAPYENINLVNSMSKKFNMRYDKLSDKARKAFISGNI